MSEPIVSNASSTQERRDESRIGLLTVIAVGIGTAASFIAYLLYHLIGLLTNLFFYQRIDASFTSPEYNHLGLFVILVPVAGGLVAGLMIKYGSAKIIGHGIPETMESVLLNQSKIDPKVGLLKAISAAFTIGSGQPFGAEGPIIQTGGAFGSFVGQIISLTASERKILLASGAAAGMAATFGTPISAVLLVVELLLFEFRVKSLVPVGVAAVVGGSLHIYLIQQTPLFQTPPYNFGGLDTLPLFVILGLMCGVVGSVLSRGLYKAEDLFQKLPIKQPWLPAVGGIFVGIIGFVVPQILGVGYNIISDVLTGQLVIGVIALVMVAKAAAWLLAMGSQTSGGTLAPLFMIGASIGALFGHFVNIFLPGMNLVPGIFAIAAMGAVFGTASRAPFASIVFTLEVTQDFQGVLPVLLAGLVAELVGEYLMEDSIMTERLARRGLRIRHIYEYNPLRQSRVSQLMSSPLVSVDSKANVNQTFKKMMEHGEEFWNRKRLIVLKDGNAIGWIDRDKLHSAAALSDPEMRIESIASDQMFTIKEKELGYEALKVMTLNDVAFLVVLSDEGQPVGYVSRGDLARAQKNKIIDESIVERSSMRRKKQEK
ncbi:MAG: chloride channel protein [Nitrososphaerales archaeon]